MNDWFDKYILNNDSVFIIAEAGINHNGDFDMAKGLASEAKKAGADCVKFQTFTYKASESKHSTMPGYFERRVGFATKKEWYASIFFTEEQFVELKSYCESIGIAFLSTACDIDGLEVLVRIKAGAVKIASADACNDYLLKAVGRSHLPVILSCGMSTLKDIDHGIGVLRKNGTTQLALTQCTSQYPAPFEDVNLRVMDTLRERYKVPIGISDHTRGMEVAVGSVALGARIIEKHFTLSRNLPGVDHAASIEYAELCRLVEAVRNVEKALGDGVKTIAASELANASNMRRSLMAARPIKTGATLSEDDITAKRPGTGMPPSNLDNLIGRKVKVDLDYEDMFDETMFEQNKSRSL